MELQVLGAGQYNGQFAVFDTRQGAAPVDATPIEHSHRCAGSPACTVIAVSPKHE